ncbi:DUF922 domain-containing protein [Flavisericum labens]|uniref:DUF922 domain-containing protein n=1 Tax=Flavisericum labens TaxID=3377112 RepID=UPI00387A8B2B
MVFSLKYIILFCWFTIGFKQDQPVKSWNESYRLSWSDFRAKPDNLVSAAAITASGITFGFSIKQTDKNQVISYSTEIHAHFYPESSWYKKGRADNHVLGHEQLHFDITELYARKLRLRIGRLKVSNTIGKKLKEINESINFELAEVQNRYDKETDFSRNQESQIKWKVYIQAELQKLSKFKSVD